MLAETSGTTVSAVAPKHQTFKHTQYYTQPERLSTILAPLIRKFQQRRIQGLLGETLLALQRPHFTANERGTAWVCFESLLRLYVDPKYKEVRCG